MELIGALRLIGKCRSYRFDTRHLQAASALHEVSRPPTEAALACAGIGIVVALRTLPKQAPPTLCYLQPGFAVEIVFCGAGLPLCLFRHASILIVAVHYEPSGSQRFVPRRLWNSKLFDGDLGNLGGVGNAGRTPHVNTAGCHGRITICALRDRRSTTESSLPFVRLCCIQIGSANLFRLSAKPNQANGSATPQRTAIGKNDAPPYLAYRAPDNKVSAAVVRPEPNA